MNMDLLCLYSNFHESKLFLSFYPMNNVLRFIYYRDSCWYAPVALKQSLKFIPVSYEKSKLWQWRVIHFILVSIKLSILISCEQWISNVNINPFWFLAQQISSISGSWSSKQKDYNWGRVATFPNKCRH